VWILRFFILLLVVALGAALATLNADTVRFDYYFDAMDLPLSMVLVVTLGVGALFGVLAGLSLSLGVRRENARLRRSLNLAEQEISNLRKLPIRDR